MTDSGRLRLDDQLCFALYSATNAIVRAYRPLLKDIGLTYPQYLVMMSLWEHRECTVNDLADTVGVPAHGVTPMLRRLETAGLVTRRRHPGDGRVVIVAPTAAGLRLEARAAAVQADVARQTQLCPQDLDALRDQLQDLVGELGMDALFTREAG